MTSPIRRYLDYINIYQLNTLISKQPPLPKQMILALQVKHSNTWFQMQKIIEYVKLNQELAEIKGVIKQSGVMKIKARIKEIKKIPGIHSSVDLIVELPQKQFLRLTFRAPENKNYVKGAEMNFEITMDAMGVIHVAK